MIVDDHAMSRAGVRAELGDTVEVLAEAAAVDQAIAAVIQHRPDVALLDVHLPGGGGVGVMRRLEASPTNQPAPRFLALSVSDAAEDVIGTIRDGARGYVTKPITGPELVAAIRRVADGDAVFSPRLAGFVLDAFAGSIDVAAVDEDLDRLTEREREVMRLIARGLRVQGGRQGAAHLDQDGRDAKVQGAPEAPALLAPRAGPLGLGPSPALTRWSSSERQRASSRPGGVASRRLPGQPPQLP